MAKMMASDASLARSPAPSALPDSIARSAALLEAAGFAANLARPGGLMAHTPGPVTSAAAAWRALTIAVQPLVTDEAEEAAQKIARRLADYGV